MEKKKSRKWWEKMLNHEIKIREDVKLQFRAIKSLNNVQDRRYTTIWKMRFSEYFRWSVFFFSLCSRRKKTIGKKLRKLAKLCGKKTEDILNSILVPLIVQLPLRINKKIDFEKWHFEHVFDDQFFFNSQYSKRNDREKIEKTC